MKSLSYHNEFVNPIYLTFDKPVCVTSPIPAPVSIIAKAIIPLTWDTWNGVVYDNRDIEILFPGNSNSIRSSLSTEETYTLRPNESEMQMRIAEILSGGVYSFLKKKGLLKETGSGEGKRYALEGMELDKLDELIRRLPKGKDLS
jgi:hypothetical protein